MICGVQTPVVDPSSGDFGLGPVITMRRLWLVRSFTGSLLLFSKSLG